MNGDSFDGRRSPYEIILKLCCLGYSAFPGPTGMLSPDIVFEMQGSGLHLDLWNHTLHLTRFPGDLEEHKDLHSILYVSLGIPRAQLGIFLCDNHSQWKVRIVKIRSLPKLFQCSIRSCRHKVKKQNKTVYRALPQYFIWSLKWCHYQLYFELN